MLLAGFRRKLLDEWSVLVERRPLIESELGEEVQILSALDPAELTLVGDDETTRIFHSLITTALSPSRFR